jgi:plasmid rolling circle replication initiator protein Rep
MNDEILTEKSFKKYKLQAAEIVLKYQAFDLKKANNIHNCGDWLEFAKKEHIQTLKTKLALQDASFCRERYCPMCLSRKSKKLDIEFYNVLRSLEAKKKLRYIFVTFTVKNPLIGDLRATIKHMNESFKRMKETKRFKNSILGFLRSTEFLGDNTKVGEAHPHFHCLFVVSTSYFNMNTNLYIKQEEFRKMWQKALQIDYLPGVNVKIIKPKKNTADPIASAIAETVKYPIKSNYLVKMSDKDFKELNAQTKGLRVLATGGIIKSMLQKMRLDLEDDSDLIHFTKEEDELWRAIELLRYQFQNGDYRLAEVKSASEETRE